MREGLGQVGATLATAATLATPPPPSFNVSQSALSDVPAPEDHVTAQAQLAAAECEEKATPPPPKPAPPSSEQAAVAELSRVQPAPPQREVVAHAISSMGAASPAAPVVAPLRAKSQQSQSQRVHASLWAAGGGAGLFASGGSIGGSAAVDSIGGSAAVVVQSRSVWRLL